MWIEGRGDFFGPRLGRLSCGHVGHEAPAAPIPGAADGSNPICPSKGARLRREAVRLDVGESSNRGTTVH
jgi:hypothetical protein